jgi:ATP-dependent DNA helicase RecG
VGAAVNAAVLNRIERILDLEEKQGWRNRGVIGGLQAMADRWEVEARKEGISPRQIDQLVALMRTYGAADPHRRQAIAVSIRQAAQPAFLESRDETQPVDQNRDQNKDQNRDQSREENKEESREESREDRTSLPPLLIPEGEPFDRAAGSPLLYTPDPETGTAEKAGGAGVPPAISPPEPTHKARARLARQQQKASRTPVDLEASVTHLAGIGEATAEPLARLGLLRIVDLLWHLPARYDDYSQLRTIAALQPGEQVTVIANLWEVRERKVGLHRVQTQAILGDSTGTLHAIWWNRWIAKQLKPGAPLRFSGKVGLYMGHKTLESPAFEEIDEERIATGRLSPVYRLTEGLSNHRLRAWIHTAVEEYAQWVVDPLPEAVRSQHALLPLPAALAQIHFPDDSEKLAAARRRFAFDELFYIQIGVQQRRAQLQQGTALPLPLDPDRLQQFQQTLPFQLTGAQERVIAELQRDLARSLPMTRLVQGDVGSGKTAVAAAAMWAAILQGAQAVLLAPTQILAEQHHRTLSRLLSQLQRPDGSPIQVALLTGRVAERSELLASLAAGTVDVVVGTTALLQEGVDFNRLALVVVDEQHRFGVAQRSALRTSSSQQPHLLVMSATPIPRSLALTVYGDLDVSRIDELPPGRSPIQTRRFTPAERERIYGFLRREVAAGRQAYIVYPLVDESDKLAVGAAVDEHKRLQSTIFPDLSLGLLHGRLSGSDKDRVMREFAEGHHSILVSTTVIEVGIDVPNASVMVVEDADRFGLAQLHQLRGRVGRGQHSSYCALISGSTAPGAQARLDVLAETHDGFVLAEKDLELRGPGDFLGTRQSGLPELRVAHFSDIATLLAARKSAQQLLADNPALSAYPRLREQVEQFWHGQGDVS